MAASKSNSSTPIGDQFRKYILDKQKKNKHILTEQELDQYTREFFGPLPPPPSGAQIVSDTGDQMVYVDPNTGQQVTVRRNSTTGAVEYSKPEIQSPLANPKVQQEQYQRVLDVQNFLSQPAQLMGLDAESKNALATIDQAINQRLAQQFQETQGNLVAQLYGRNVNQSSLANDAAARLAQEQGLVQTQASAESANRELQLRQLLTDYTRQGKTLDLQTAQNLLGQGVNVQQQNINTGFNYDQSQQAATQLLNNIELQRQQIELQRQQLEAQKGSILGKVLSAGASLALNAALPGIGTAISGGLGSIFTRGSGITDSIIPGANNTGGYA